MEKKKICHQIAQENKHVISGVSMCDNGDTLSYISNVYQTADWPYSTITYCINILFPLVMEHGFCK